MVFAPWQRNIVNGNGDVQASAFIEVRQEISGAGLAVIYADREGTTPLANPFQADADGFARFYVAGGAYRITATKGAFQRVWRHVGIGTAQETDYDALTGGLTVTYPSFVPDAVVDQLADRDAYDGQFVGFSVLVRFDDSSPPVDDPRVYFLLNPDESPAEWTDGIAFANALGGLPIDTLADPGADAFLGWDDSAGFVQFLTNAEAKAALGYPTSTTDNTVPRFDLTAGNLQTSGVVIDDDDRISFNPTNATASSATTYGIRIVSDAAENALCLGYDGTKSIIQCFSSKELYLNPQGNRVVIGSGQLGFPATQAPSSDANTLDDYEEGVWTADITSVGGGQSVTYGTRVTAYTKIGNRVFYDFDVTIATISSGSGNARVALPFTGAASSSLVAAACMTGSGGGPDWATGTSLVFVAQSSAAYGEFFTSGDNIAIAGVAITGLAANDRLFVTGQQRV